MGPFTNSINTMNFWHIFDSGSKFEILKPNSSWLTFGISKFVSLSISHFLFLFLQLFLNCAVRYQHCTIILAITSHNYYLWLLHLKITTFGYYILKFYLLATSSENFKILFIVSYNINILDPIAVNLKPYSH